MLIDKSYSCPSFRAIPGKRLLNAVEKEVNYDAKRLAKFKTLFCTTFQENIDDKLVVDIDKRNNFVFSHELLGGAKFLQKNVGLNSMDIARSVLSSCLKTIANGEVMFFRVFVAKSIKNGCNFDELRKLSKFINREKSRDSYFKTISMAEQIKKDNPFSKLKTLEFDEMSMIIDEADMKNPNSELYKFVNRVFNRNI